MAVGLTPPRRLAPVAGIRLASAPAGIRYQGRDDLVLMEIAPGAATAAVFTRNAFAAAPVSVGRTHLANSSPRYLLINSGNANAGTGEAGLRDALACCQAVARACGCAQAEVLPFSTGVIGAPLAVARITAALPGLARDLCEDGWLAVAQAIMTTDTVPKGISHSIDLEGGRVWITGVAKGAGMIRPDMATMLAFVASDIRMPQSLLEAALRDAVAGSFNAITVDGDTSTNDACVVMATGRSGVAIEREDEPGYTVFRLGLSEAMGHLAQSIVRDGEGATKFITVQLRGVPTEREARQVAYTVAHSPLVKTAFFASDPNWGRILAAVGRSEVAGLDATRVDIHLDDLPVVQGGAAAPGYTEAAGCRVMSSPEIRLVIDLKLGHCGAEIWTTDLSHDYVRINAEYRS
jgi:glutamate N-acetyltransferase/amino-acid N-acetyltransferase